MSDDDKLWKWLPGAVAYFFLSCVEGVLTFFDNIIHRKEDS